MLLPFTNISWIFLDSITCNIFKEACGYTSIQPFESRVICITLINIFPGGFNRLGKSWNALNFQEGIKAIQGANDNANSDFLFLNQ